MKAKTTILAALAGLAGAALGDDVATLESNLKADILDKVNQVNPIDSATGQRKYISNVRSGTLAGLPPDSSP